MSVNNLAKCNGIKNKNIINVGQVLKLKVPDVKPNASTNKTYTVKSGGTLSGIAVKLDSTVKKLHDKTDVKSVNKIYVGQKNNY